MAPPSSTPPIVGVHHIKLPVTNVLESRDWYTAVFGFEPILDYEEEDGVLGIVLEHPCGITLSLHLEPQRAAALRRFPAVAFCVGGHEELKSWCAYLDDIDVKHTPMGESHIGWSIQIADPDEIGIQLHTRGHPTADEA